MLKLNTVPNNEPNDNVFINEDLLNDIFNDDDEDEPSETDVIDEVIRELQAAPTPTTQRTPSVAPGPPNDILVRLPEIISPGALASLGLSSSSTSSLPSSSNPIVVINIRYRH